MLVRILTRHQHTEVDVESDLIRVLDRKGGRLSLATQRRVIGMLLQQRPILTIIRGFETPRAQRLNVPADVVTQSIVRGTEGQTAQQVKRHRLTGFVARHTTNGIATNNALRRLGVTLQIENIKVQSN